MGRKLIVLFDGTWNNGRDRTNVYQLYQLLAERDRQGQAQLARYIEGVGTRPHTRLFGGLFGIGLTDNLMEGYHWLCDNYLENDEIYSFGFSRGAYTARSLVGMIRKCGLLNNASKNHLDMALGLYRNREAAPFEELASDFRARHSREIRVKMIGVWDTVGRLGIPVAGVPLGSDRYRWHDTRLSKIVDYAYHAIAVDEYREDFNVAVWEDLVKPENRKVEQRWFIGAHSNVGGGYDHDRLHRISLQWMLDKADATGLCFTRQQVQQPRDHLGGIADSHDAFAFGLYKHFKPPLPRVFGLGQKEVVDDSVWLRWQQLPAYRPQSIAHHNKDSS